MTFVSTEDILNGQPNHETVRISDGVLRRLRGKFSELLDIICRREQARGGKRH